MRPKRDPRGGPRHGKVGEREPTPRQCLAPSAGPIDYGAGGEDWSTTARSICGAVRFFKTGLRRLISCSASSPPAGDPYSGKFPGASEGEGICIATAGDGAKDGLIGRSNIKRHFPHF